VIDIEFGVVEIHEGETRAGDLVDVEIERVENTFGQERLAGT
jgi:hypothetical protein